MDVSNLIFSKKRKILTGVSYTVAKTNRIFFDDWRKNIQNRLEARLPGYEVDITSFSEDETKAIVVSYSDKSRGTYYFYDISKDKLTDLGKISPWLNEEELGSIGLDTSLRPQELSLNDYIKCANLAWEHQS